MKGITGRYVHIVNQPLEGGNIWLELEGTTIWKEPHGWKIQVAMFGAWDSGFKGT